MGCLMDGHGEDWHCFFSSASLNSGALIITVYADGILSVCANSEPIDNADGIFPFVGIVSQKRLANCWI